MAVSWAPNQSVELFLGEAFFKVIFNPWLKEVTEEMAHSFLTGTFYGYFYSDKCSAFPSPFAKQYHTT